MSEEGVQIFEKGLAGWNREGITGVLPCLTADVVGYPFPEWPGPGVYRGHDGIAELAAEWTENFDDYKWEKERVIDGGEQIVALVHHRGRIKGTEVPVTQQMGTIWGDVRDAKFGEVYFFLTWKEALEAAGMSE